MESTSLKSEGDKDKIRKVCLIIGANGQDGSYACELYLAKGYEVHGTIRRSSVITTERIDHIFGKLQLHYCDVTDSMNVLSIISKVKPTLILNFSAQSHVQISAELENYTFQTNTIGVLNILQSVRVLGLDKTCRIYQSSTSEQFGNQTDGDILLNEESKQSPVSIYGISKNAAQQICGFYRTAYDMFIVSSWLFNHESSRRAHNFVTKKITDYVGRYNKYNKGDREGDFRPLQLGNLNSRRDWGFAGDYVEAISLAMEKELPEDYVIATGETHSIRDFIQLAFKRIGVNISFSGEGLEEVGKNDSNGEVVVVVNSKYFRALELDTLIGDAGKAKRDLGWEPKTTFEELVNMMVDDSVSKNIL